METGTLRQQAIKNTRLLFIIVIAVGVIVALASPRVEAHRLRPAIATIKLMDRALNDGGTFEVGIVLNMEVLLAGISPIHEDTNESPQATEYNALRLLEPGDLQARIEAFLPTYLDGIVIAFDGAKTPLSLVSLDVPGVGDPDRERLTTIRLAGRIPAGARNLTWAYAAEFGASAVRVGRTGAEAIQSAFLNEGESSHPFPIGDELAPRSRWQVAGDYIALGFTHILPKGADHILFVLGIFLLSLHWRPLLYQVTAFTVAHSITLGLSLYGIVSLPASIVEPLIALSIVYVAVENILTANLKPWRVYVVFGFGLLHGLGFAGVLTALGLPRNEFVTALIGFNVGVELGQLAVITGAFLAVGAWFRDRPWYRRAIVIPGSAAIALTGAFWTIQRVFGA